MIFYN